MSSSQRSLRFTKMHGAGNDFVVLDALHDELPEDLSALARRIAHRRFGIGCDQVLVVRTSNLADFRMEIFNPDGGQVEMCGNGIRAFFKYLRDAGHTTANELDVETLSGVVRPLWVGADRIRVDMARPILAPAKIPTTLGQGEGPVLDVELDLPATLSPDGGGFIRLSSVSMGNPHAIIEVPDVDEANVAELGAHIEHHPAFPSRVNVEFITPVSRTRIRQRTWERGTGETLACGTGACAVAVSSMLRGAAERNLVIELRGGELEIEWADNEAHVFMTGPATEVFSGEIPLGETTDR